MVGMKALQQKQTVVAILCFLPCLIIVGLIFGWIKQAQWGISKNLMLAFTALFVLAIVFAGVNAATATTVVTTR